MALPDYSEDQGSPLESYGPNGLEVKRTLRCAFGDRHALADGLVGTAYSIGGATATAAICRTAAIKPFEAQQQGSGSYAAYEQAIVEADFTKRDPASGTTPETVGADLVAETFEGNAEFMTLPHQDTAGADLYFWDNTQTKAIAEKEAPGMLLAGFDYVLTKYNVTTIPTTALTLQGKVNAAGLSCRTTGLTGLTFAAETLLFHPPTIARVITTDGAKAWTQNLRFKYKPTGWNKFWRNDTTPPGWATMYDASGNAVAVYPTASFAGL